MAKCRPEAKFGALPSKSILILVLLLRQALTPGTTGRCESIALTLNRTMVSVRASTNVPKWSERSKQRKNIPQGSAKKERKKKTMQERTVRGSGCYPEPEHGLTNSALLLSPVTWRKTTRSEFQPSPSFTPFWKRPP